MSKPLYFSCWGHKQWGAFDAIDRKFVREGKLLFEVPYAMAGFGPIKTTLLDNISSRIRDLLEIES